MRSNPGKKLFDIEDKVIITEGASEGRVGLVSTIEYSSDRYNDPCAYDKFWIYGVALEENGIKMSVLCRGTQLKRRTNSIDFIMSSEAKGNK